MNYFEWDCNFAYAVGLIATDGNLSKDGRHIDLTSKDRDQLENFKKCLRVEQRITLKSSSYSTRKYYRIQVGSVRLYQKLIRIGLTPAKSKTIGALHVPDRYFLDFLRGVLDGDGSTYSYWDPRWRSSFMYYMQFSSASLTFLEWVQGKVSQLLFIQGTINYDGRSTYVLRYAKRSAILLTSKMYYADSVICLERKRKKVQNTLDIIQAHAEVA